MLIFLVDEVPINFRGPLMRSIAKRIAQSDLIDVNRIGSAAKESQ
ncbi:DUF3626 domain-containing protein [Paenibacillus sp. MCAF9]